MFELIVRRPVAVSMLSIAATLFGFLAYRQLPVALMPPLNYPTLTIQTLYGGAAPQEVESEITNPIEERLGTLENLGSIRSRSKAGVSEVQLELRWGVDLNQTIQRVYERLDRIQLPKNVDPPQVLRYDPTLEPIMVLALTPPVSTDSSLNSKSLTDTQHSTSQSTLVALRKYAEEVMTPMLHQIEGVAAVKILGGNLAQVDIDLYPDAMQRYGLTVVEVADKIRSSHVNLAGGQLITEQGQILLRTLSELTTLEDLREVLVYQIDNTWVKLKDIARVELGIQEKESRVQVGKQEAVRVQIYRQAESNLVSVSQKLRQYLFQPKIMKQKDLSRRKKWGKYKKGKNKNKNKKGKSQRQQNKEGKDQKKQDKSQLKDKADKDQSHENHTQHSHQDLKNSKKSKIQRQSDKIPQLTQADFRSARALALQIPHPKGVKAYLIQDQSRFIEDALSAVNQAIVIGGLLAIIILFLFLRSFYNTLVVAVAIPLSVVLCFIPLHFLGVSLNLMSLGGLALGVGMLVDNAVVVLESISRVRETQGPSISLMQSAVQGVKEVASAVFASTLTTVAVFAPVAFIEGLAGQVFKDLALTVVSALIASLLVALIVVPMLCGRTWKLDLLTASTEVSPDTTSEVSRWKRIHHALNPLPINQIPRAWKQWKQATWSSKIFYLIFWPIPVIELVLTLVANSLIACLVLTLLILAIPYKILQLVLYRPLQWSSVWVGVLLKTLEQLYLKSLTRSISRPSIVLILTILVLWSALRLFPQLPRSLLPEVAQGVLLVEVEYPVGSTLESTHKRVSVWIDKLVKDQRVKRIDLLLGQDEDDEQAGETRGPHQGRLTLNLAHRNLEEPMSQMLRIWAQQEAGIHVKIKRPSLLTIKPPIRVVIRAHRLDILKRVEQQIYQEMQKLSGLSDIEITFGQAYPEIKLEYDYARLAMLGLSPLSVAQQLRNQLKGYEALEVLWNGEKLPIILRKAGAVLTKEDDLPHLRIQREITQSTESTLSNTIPLASIAHFKVGEGPSEIRHVDGQRAAEISAHVNALELGSQSQKLTEMLQSLLSSSQVDSTLSGQDAEMKASLKQLSFTLLLSLFLIYVVMATQFESVRLPLLIMGAVPLASIGVIATLWYTHTPLSVVVFVGFITLSGIVVNNAIVFLDAAHKQVRLGQSKKQALLYAGQQRLRPILMTTLSTLIGLIPMLSPLGEGAELRIPLALTLMGGLLSSTVLVLYVLPALYQLFAQRVKIHSDLPVS
jgi:hydrophobic/amphiphilic exporter-1 (mainly G- bacteria), HAE1 family